MKDTIPLAKKELALLATMASLSKERLRFSKKYVWRRCCKSRKMIPLVISNEDIDYIIRILKSGERSGVLVDRVIETVKHEIK